MRDVLKPAMRIGLISDTHGLVRPEAERFLAGSQMIIHCGDICGPEVLEQLSRIAPVTAVRGNNDQGAWAQGLSEYEMIPIGELCAYAIHDLADMDIDPAGAGVAVVLSGHSHRPCVERRAGVLFVNPGSAGPRRFKLPISVGELIVEGGAVTARTVELDAR
jgi:putative phosphoesterase